jgi:oxygen-independent coproporphyrinogen-3 oxidase
MSLTTSSVPQSGVFNTIRKSPVVSERIGIYIHVPFCERKCSYCDFYSVENRSRQTEYVRCLTKEIEILSAMFPEPPEVDSIFFGGGTPSLLSEREVESILNVLHKSFAISVNTECTMECNPGTVSRAVLASYRQMGINRLSFGVQSFFDDELAFLSRIHNSRQAIEAFEWARSEGYANVNIDLMYGLPNQKEERVMRNLEKAIELIPSHISAYGLILEHGTPLFNAVTSGRIKPIDELTEVKMYGLVMNFLNNHGYEHYEISNYALPGHKCRHNLKYWNCNEYIGFGPSAHSFLNNTRWWNYSSLGVYISELSLNRLPVSSMENLTQIQLIDEFIMLQLRQGKLSLKILKERFALTVDPNLIEMLVQNGYITISNDEIILTNKGFTVCDKIVEEILSSGVTRIENPKRSQVTLNQSPQNFITCSATTVDAPKLRMT